MITYEMFPPHFQHCMLADCPHSEVCLRFRAFSLAPETAASFTLLNPGMLRTQDLSQCSWLLSGELQTHTRGLSAVLENLPYTTVQKIRQDLIALMGRSAYYRHLRNELWLTPAVQEQVREIFCKYGVEEHLVYPESSFFL
ncbi:DUF6078 family protein [Kaistella sp.]|uniref:DUF6078 family protein n=1 Tax=Kaistella sp. TaxID=2782235 RepID=UPI002F9444C6